LADADLLEPDIWSYAIDGCHGIEPLAALGPADWPRLRAQQCPDRLNLLIGHRVPLLLKCG
jgi:hypothetical protein